MKRKWTKAQRVAFNHTMKVRKDNGKKFYTVRDGKLVPAKLRTVTLTVVSA